MSQIICICMLPVTLWLLTMCLNLVNVNTSLNSTVKTIVMSQNQHRSHGPIFRLSVLNPSLFYNREFAVVFCCTKIMLIINCKDITSSIVPWPPWYFVILLCLLVMWPNNWDMWGSFWLFLLCMHSCLSSILTYMLAFLLILCPYDLYVFVLLPYLHILQWCSYDYFSSFDGSPGYDQYLIHKRPIGLQFLCTLVFVESQPQSTSSVNALRCSSARVISFISFDAIQSGISMHDSIALMVMCVLGISLNLFV